MNHSTVGLCLTCILATALSGCSREPEGESSPVADKPATTVSAKSPEGDAAFKRMVSGVSASKDNSSVELKFELQARPQIGQPLPIEIALLAKVNAESMQLIYVSPEALVLQPIKVPAQYHNVQAGNIYHHQVSVTPRNSGVYYLSAIVMLDNRETGSLTRTFAIPVLIGAPADAPAAPGTDPAH
ncbi:MAG TPA: hypothetical protein VEZ88_10920 [Steroidobacteraceae bacterium]|nr:hypothetical protein [Steroidobacteraceae bacterium]